MVPTRRWGAAALSALVPALVAAAPPSRPAEKPVDYLRDVRPILATKCLACHGPDDKARQGGLRLDERGAAVAVRHGQAAWVPGKPERSGALLRIEGKGGPRMPPESTGPGLSTAEIDVLRRWVRQGATYRSHWAFTAPVRPVVPKVPGARHPIDALVRSRLAGAGLAPSRPADRRTLIRRVSLDLTGLPPAPAEVDAFVADNRPGAYERVVDRLLASPHYGERMARPWLDIARYADSAGYGSDPLRPNLWPWREWVIDAFNRNVPYDQFSILQLAGDLLPGATDQDRVATAFHRNTMTNTEGGTSDEEFRTAAVKDRAIVTAQAWMGLTLQCAQCHHHKFDPIRQPDFYAFAALFNQTEDNDQGDERPTLRVISPTQAKAAADLDARIAKLEPDAAAERTSQQARGRFVRVTLPAKGDFLMLAEVEVISGGRNVAQGRPARQSSTDFGGDAGRAVDGRTDGNFPANSTTHTAAENNPWWEVDLGADTEIESVVLWPRTDAHVGRLKDLGVSVLDAERRVVGARTFAGAFTARRDGSLAVGLATLALEALRAERAAIRTVDLPVLKELPADKRRTTHVLTLGNYLQKGSVVAPGVPSVFGALPAGASPDRLALARWLFSSSNPLVARVAVNRYWAQLFGKGLVETEEDFGTQGAAPVQPELLDWLAVEFRTSGWDVKRLLRTIVLSDTYRQSSRTEPVHRLKDPANRLLSRYPRRRLDAEGVRDQALAVSGLLTRTIGGPSVYPPQPDGLWQAAFNGERNYPTSTGPDRYRRGLYTFWRRTVPHPSMATFDAPSRESCTLRRQPTNTPLQALVTLNDPIYVEAAQALAKRIVAEAPRGLEARAWYGLRVATGQIPGTDQIAALVRLHRAERARFAADPESAAKMAGMGVPEADRAEMAAWTVVANVLLNLDAVLTVG